MSDLRQLWPQSLLSEMSEIDPTMVIFGPTTHIVTRRHRTAGNVYCNHAQLAGTPLRVPGRMIRPASSSDVIYRTKGVVSAIISTGEACGYRNVHGFRDHIDHHRGYLDRVI